MDKTLDVSLRLRDGDIAFQQDTIVHDRIIYSETILAFIAMIAGRNCGRIDIVDFGGSLGTNFMQNKKILEPFIKEAKCSWNIIERKLVVDLGREHFESGVISFFNEIDEIKTRFNEIPNSILFSSSLQYLETPFSFVEKIIENGAQLIAFDRVLVSPNDSHRIFVQQLDPSANYHAKLPTWCFSRNLLVKNMASYGFALVEEFSMPPGGQFDCRQGPGAQFYWCGMIFERHG